jgi:purine-binding chemotaxis protein CheW
MSSVYCEKQKIHMAQDEIKKNTVDTVAKKVIEAVAKKETRPEDKVVPTEQLVTFELDKEEYASTITDLREIIKIPDITPIPGAQEFIRGILNLRGQIVVVVDLEKRFNLKREHPAEPKHIIIAEVEDSVFGVTVDEVTGVLRVPKESIKMTPHLVASKIQSEYLKGVVILEDEKTADKKKATKKKKDETPAPVEEGTETSSRLLLLLDIPKMLAEKELLEFGTAVRETFKKVDNNVTEKIA